MNKKIRLAVVGCGISGLSCIYECLKKYEQNHNISHITLFDANDCAGGVLQNTRHGQFLLEHGAQGVLSSRSAFVKLVNELQLTGEISGSASAMSKKFLLFKNHVIGLGPKYIFSFFKSGLLTKKSVFRILKEFFIPQNPQKQATETVYDFFSRRFGVRFTESFVQPLMNGIWGGGSKKVLMRHGFPAIQKIELEHGGLLRFALKKIFAPKKNTGDTKKLLSFNDGMQAVPKALLSTIEKMCAEKNIVLTKNFNTQVQSMEWTADEKFILNLDDNMKEVFDLVIYSGQPWRDLNFSFKTDAKFKKDWDVLTKVESHSIAVVGLGGVEKNPQENPLKNGFGALAVNGCEATTQSPHGALGVICVHNIQPGHAPQDSFLYRVLLGGEQNPNIWQNSSQDLLLKAKDVLNNHGITNASTHYDFGRVLVWKNVLPLLTQDQENIIQAIWTLECFHPGLFFVGNYIKGPAVADCVEYSTQTAEKIMNFLELEKTPL